MRERITMTPERWGFTADYLIEVFGREPESLAALRKTARDAGLPDIAVSADVGRLLHLLTKMSGARVAVELGTLAGYSGTWIATALGEGGKLTTVELDPHHADVAEAHFAGAGLGDRVELVRGAALDVLPEILRRLGTIDLAFIDAVKTEYPEYWTQLRPHIRVGGLFIADNVLGSSQWWIDQHGHPAREAVDRLNRAVAADPDFEAVGLSVREGVLVARRTR